MYTPSEFAELYDRHASDVLRVATDVLRDVRLAEEVVQDVFLSLWRDRRHDPERGPLGPFLRSVARNRALDLWRRGDARQRTADRYRDQASLRLVADDAHAEAELNQRRAAAWAAVERLPQDQQRAIALAYWGGLTMQESAAHQGIPLGTVKSRVRLALRRLADDAELAGEAA
jgi:RNA polymerase sigma-70 factor (ECF subfamily)